MSAQQKYDQECLHVYLQECLQMQGCLQGCLQMHDQELQGYQEMGPLNMEIRQTK